MLDALLERLVDEVNKGLLATVPEKPDYLYEPIRRFLQTGGKRIRAVVPCLIRQELKGSYEDVFTDAITIELFHNFTLIHDDIEDNSSLRRGKPSLHTIYGVPVALNAGDFLYTLVFKRVLNSHIPEKMVNVFNEVVEGQALELWTERFGHRLSDKEVYEIGEKKTGALLGLAFYLGAWDQRVADRLEKAGRNIGVAFQLIDDYLNIVGDETKYGKEIGGDIKEGKVTLIIARTAREFPNIYDYLGTDKVEEAIAIIKKTDALEYTKEKAERLTQEALDLIPEDLTLTRQLAERLLRRKK